MTDMVVYSSEQRQLIHETVAKGCSETEFALLMELAKRYELDPFQKQIWAVKYGSREAAIFCGRDGFLAIAHRSGQFDGMERRAAPGKTTTVRSSGSVAYGDET